MSENDFVNQAIDWQTKIFKEMCAKGLIIKDAHVFGEATMFKGAQWSEEAWLEDVKGRCEGKIPQWITESIQRLKDAQLWPWSNETTN